jgi:uncharacterized membrane protein YeaQ/YmgE (transglycosylase-associated protein family)
LTNLVLWMLVGLIAVGVGRQVISRNQTLGPIPTIVLALAGAGAGAVSAQFVNLGAVRSVTNFDWISGVITLFVVILAILAFGIFRR